MDIHRAVEGCAFRKTKEYQPETEKKMTVDRLFARLSHFVPENAIVVAETGVSLFGVAEMLMPKGAKFIGQVFYGSIGFTVGATLGISIAAPDRKVILCVGDGSFQVTAQDLSTMIRYKTKPTIILLNNDGYTIERLIIDGPYNDIQPWKYHRLPEIYGGEKGYDIYKEGEFDEALKKNEHSHTLNFLEVHLERMDCTQALAKAGETMATSNFVKLD